MSSLEVIEALSPGSQQSNLNKFTASYKAANSNFVDLLTYPFLQSIVLVEGNKDLRTIVVDGNSRFGQLCITDTSIARQVINYAKTIPGLLHNLTVGGYATTYKPVVAQYVAQALASTNGNEQFFESFQTRLFLLDKQIALVTSQIADLTTQIEHVNDELAQTNVSRVIRDIIKALFKLSDSSEDRDIQIAALLNVGLETLKSKFSQLWPDRRRLEELIKGLTTLKDNLSTVKALFTALSSSLTGIISDTKSLLYLWSDVQAHLGRVETVERSFTSQEIQQIADKWAKAEQAAEEYIEAVTSSGATKAPSIQSLLKTMAARSSTLVSRIPRTKAELRIAELIASLGPETRTAARGRYTSSLSSSNLRDENSDMILNAAGPPKETQAVLDDMALQTSGVMKQFNDLLQLPYLNQLQVNDPNKPSEKINLQDMVLNYQKLYWDLQQMTIPVAQDLQSYSDIVLALLPMLPNEISVETYLAAHKGLANDFKVQADEIYKESSKYKDHWDKAIKAVLDTIDECKKNIEAWEKTVDQLSEEVKQQTLYAILYAVGAILIFAASAVVPGGMLVTGGLLLGGSALLFMSLKTLVEIGELNQAISELKIRIATARDTQEKLETLLPYMQKIADSLTGITDVWSDISKNLNDVSAWNLLLSTEGQQLLDSLKPKLIQSWTDIKNASQKYIDIITGQTRDMHK